VSPLWKAARVGERLSPYVSLACVVMAVSTILDRVGTRTDVSQALEFTG
jgi:hypothetical protein